MDNFCASCSRVTVLTLTQTCKQTDRDVSRWLSFPSFNAGHDVIFMMFCPRPNRITQNNCDKISHSLRFRCDSNFLTLIWDSVSACLEAGGSLCMSVFQENAFRVAHWKHFWALSCSLVGRLPDNVASGWVFAHSPVSFQGAPQVEVVSHLFTAARTHKRWVSLVRWDCSMTKEHLSRPKTSVRRITLKEDIQEVTMMGYYHLQKDVRWGKKGSYVGKHLSCRNKT